MPRSYVSIYYHVVWATSKREPMIDSQILCDAVKHHIEMLFQQHSCVVYEIAVQPDHVHAVVSIPPTQPISKVVGQVKGATAHHFNLQNHALRWHDGYGVLSFAYSDMKRIRNYVANQDDHHRIGQTWQSLEMAATDDVTHEATP